MPTIDTDLMRAIDLEFPRIAGMPEFPTHKPSYAFTLYHRQSDDDLASQAASRYFWHTPIRSVQASACGFSTAEGERQVC